VRPLRSGKSDPRESLSGFVPRDTKKIVYERMSTLLASAAERPSECHLGRMIVRRRRRAGCVTERLQLNMRSRSRRACRRPAAGHQVNHRPGAHRSDLNVLPGLRTPREIPADSSTVQRAGLAWPTTRGRRPTRSTSRPGMECIRARPRSWATLGSSHAADRGAWTWRCASLRPALAALRPSMRSIRPPLRALEPQM
jgi:hypothetical protein